MLEEFYSVAFRKKVYTTIEQLQADLDEWLRYYNEERPHSGRYCYGCAGKTPMQTFREAKHLADEKMPDRQVALWANTRVQASDRQEVGVAPVG